MDEYITKDQVIEWFRPYGHSGKDIPFYVLDDDIFEMKAADVAPVRHGRWECQKPCPVCGKDRFDGLDADIWADWNPPYCPNCGAKMDEEVSE